MTFYLGETIRIKTDVTDPDTSLPPVGVQMTAVADFWAPGVNRKTADPTISSQTMTFRNETTDFVLYVDTGQDPWVVGKWTYRVTVTGPHFENFDFATVTLKN